MVKHNIRIFAFAILGLAFIVYATIFLLTQNLDSIDIHKAITHVSTTISINIILWMIFIAWGWKLKIFYPWLVPFPNLSGDWEGNIKSNWKEKELEPIPIEVSITQNFFNVQVRIKTKESRSYSIGASFDIDNERGFQQIYYTYLNSPKAGVRERSEIHYGSTILNFDGFKVTKMDGEYWTDRETTGEITLTKKNVA
ncbi:MAG: hypothetical protein M0Q90_13390 [Bacteroidales bacterium]|nr:hypothetical protein [Bacteroidales bacterium]